MFHKVSNKGLSAFKRDDECAAVSACTFSNFNQAVTGVFVAYKGS